MLNPGINLPVHVVVECYSGLYEEGEVEYVNCVWPVFITQQLI